MTFWRDILSTISRKKSVCLDEPMENTFRRTLGILDLFGLSVGLGLGCGGYVLMPHIVRIHAGPSAVLSILIAAITALLAGLFHCETVTRFPRLATAYVTAYVTMGELLAFLIGWTLWLDYILLACVSAKAWSDYFDYLLGHRIHRYLVNKLPMSGGVVFDSVPDIPASVLLLFITCVQCFIKKAATVFNFVIIVISVVITVAIVCVGVFHVDSENWRKPPGFFPYGFFGTLQGAAIIYSAFLGYDVISSLVEETKEPKRTVPKSIKISFILCFLANFTMTLAVTLTYSWQKMSASATLPQSFGARGIAGSDYVVGIGALLAFTAAVTATMLISPRFSFVLAQDGLLFSVFSRVSRTTHLPICSTITTGVITTILSIFFSLELHIEMLSIGALFSTAIMSISIILLRYSPSTVGNYAEYESVSSEAAKMTYMTEQLKTRISRSNSEANVTMSVHKSELDGMQEHGEYDERCKETMNDYGTPHYERSASNESPNVPLLLDSGNQFTRHYVMVQSQGSTGSYSSLLSGASLATQPPNVNSYKTVKLTTAVLVAALSCLGVIAVCGKNYTNAGEWWVVCLLCLFVIIVTACIVIIAKQPQNPVKLVYSTPYVPCLPIAVLAVILFMVASLSKVAWIRFFIWAIPGLTIYVLYGARNSGQNYLPDHDVILTDVESELHTDVRPDYLLS